MNKDDAYVRAEGSIASYATGFAISLILTLMAFFLVYKHLLAGGPLLLTLAALAVAQLFVQMIFFFHVWHDDPPHWNGIAFFFMVLVVVTIVWGTLWIMYHLDYRMM